MTLKGKCSEFGGLSDVDGMTWQEGLALFEHSEADGRPDLFLPRSVDLTQGTSKRLREDALYIALPLQGHNKSVLRKTLFRVSKAGTEASVDASIVDYGPAEWTGRIADLSPEVMRRLSLSTDDEVCVTMV